MAEPDALLDGGRPGLRYFSVLGPRHAALAPQPLPWRTAPERYDEQVGLTTGPLREDAATVRRVGAELAAELAQHESQRGVVAAGWSGAGADAAHAALSSAGASATALQSWLADVADALEGCAETVEQLVADKADHVGALRPDQVVGTTPEELDDLTMLARADPADGSVDDVVRGLAPWFADRGAEHLARLPEPVAESRARAVELAEGFLRGRVVPALEATWHDFDRVCRRADDGVREALADLAAVLERSPAGPVAPVVPQAARSADPAAGDGLRLDPAAGDDAARVDPAAADAGAAVSAQSLHAAGAADPGAVPTDATGPDSGAALAGAGAHTGGPVGPSGAVLAGSAAAADVGRSALLDSAGGWPWHDLLAPAPPRGSERFSLADLLSLVREVVLERR
ncbi:hypothetical protein GCM10027047_28030 [Rhodococcus aerolatus]